MKTAKRTAARLRPGLYNYRAYLIFASAMGGWIVKNEEGGVYERTRTLAAMRRKIDGWEREAQRAEKA